MLMRLGCSLKMEEKAVDEGAREVKAASSFGVSIFSFFVFFFLLKPDVNRGLALFGLDNPVPVMAWKTALVLVSCACVVLFLLRRRSDMLFMATAACVAWVTVVTLVNGGGLGRILEDWFPLLAVVSLVGAFARSNWLELVRAMFAASMSYLILNLVGIVLSGQIGFQTQVFLFFGIRTATFKVAIPAIACAFLLDAARGKRISVLSVSACLISLVEVYIGYCATTLVVIVMLIVLRVICEFVKMREVLNIFTYAATDILVFFGVVVLRIQSFFSWFIEGILRRSVTLSGRTSVWDAVFALLNDWHLAVGYGASYIWSSVNVNGMTYMHAHNDILNILMTGGIVLVVLVAMVFLSAALQLYRNRGSVLSSILAAALFCFMVIGLFEITNCVGSFFLLAVSRDAGIALRREDGACSILAS